MTPSHQENERGVVGGTTLKQVGKAETNGREPKPQNFSLRSKSFVPTLGA